ncbi:SGNH/GDSL hydrolase family protein [Pseudomonas aeruginosa]|uniref:SGNH/GDSL hydrolase family protein n=1 Tax=Pseudomonas aeruginosa TaxID=287 RepID=UPI0021E9182E|nr:SGNH/GDSL hydrolase family protein [Pseudomonas aeruginosa]MCV3851707.1 SGNH/GDSL hydrolase family protein [Pseudomonas aeruginosa]MCV3857738.1 SGNH/GDSL hydrolase family protein [Pseudomonas aeruginosa]
MSEVMDQAVIGMPYEMALGCEVSRRQYYSRANAVLAERDALAAKLAMLEDAAAKGDAARQQCGGMEMEIEELRAELAELRARVVVLPEPLNEGEARRECGEYGAAMQRGYNACLRELARINGMTVSESALDTLRRFATGNVKHLNNGLCPDDIEGHEARDPDCPVCRALIETGKESDNV